MKRGSGLLYRPELFLVLFPNTTVLQSGYPILIVLVCRGVRQYVLWDEPQ